MRRPSLALLLMLLAGCATLVGDALDARFGPADPARFDQPLLAVPGGVSYRRDVKPILESRCVVCHGCYDAPCQLKLDSHEGIARGATPVPVYGDLRLNEAEPTRLGIDAQQPSQWRQRGFHAVLNERTRSPENDLAASLLWRTLAHKQAHPMPAGGVLPEGFDFSLDRANACTPLAGYDAYEKAQPLAGMPYGLPALAPQELAVLQRWLQAGAPNDPPAALPAAVAAQVAAWERFLNGPTTKERLMSRYLYEHLFLGHLVFEGDGQRHVFRLVRSATPPGQPVRELATRRPFDDPGPALHYRLRPELDAILAKTHLPFTLSPQRMARWRGWFLDPPYRVDTLPGYAPDLASNPFATFAALPLDSRYRFLLDDAQFFVANFIKGPVCRGQTALDVINDRFWVFFVDPTIGADEASAHLVAREAEVLRLPAAEGSNTRLLTSWRALAASEDRFLQAKSAVLNQRFGGRRPVDLSLVWHGDAHGSGHNPNAALTIFRHFDSASVVQGLVGEPPKTAWLIDYPLLERIYYLLVAGYDVWGNTEHQVATRLFMDYLRMEGEANLLLLLPKAARLPLRDHWYRGVDEEVKSRVAGSRFRFEGESGITYRTREPQQQLGELYGLLRGRLGAALGGHHSLASEPDAAVRAGLEQLAALRGPALAWWPEAAHLLVQAPGQPARHFTVLRNTGHLNVSTLFSEDKALAPAENALTVVPGFIGAYPNAILRSTPADLPVLARAVAALASDADYSRLADRFAVRRSDPGFWAVSDALHQAYRRAAPAEAGLLDYSRLQNR